MKEHRAWRDLNVDVFDFMYLSTFPSMINGNDFAVSVFKLVVFTAKEI